MNLSSTKLNGETTAARLGGGSTFEFKAQTATLLHNIVRGWLSRTWSPLVRYGDFRRFQMHPDRTMAWVTHRTVEEVFIVVAESALSKALQKPHSILVAHTQFGNAHFDDVAANVPGLQDVSQIRRDVFVRQVHAARARQTSSSIRAVRRRCNGSAMEAFPSSPSLQCKMMKSSERQFSIWAIMCNTKMREAMKVTLPFHNPGSPMMCGPIQARLPDRFTLFGMVQSSGALRRSASVVTKFLQMLEGVPPIRSLS